MDHRATHASPTDEENVGGEKTTVPPWLGVEARAIFLDGDFWQLLRTGWALYNKL